MNNFKYDVAFSFLAEDEAIAQNLADIVSEQCEVFLYSERQKDLAGKDGETEFSDVFAKQSRIVVVLYREQWGQTTWTRIEETAIRGRAYDEGYDFTLFIPLDEKVKTPAWLPKTRLYHNLGRFGEESAAAVIISKIVEHNGDPKSSSPVDEARRFQVDLDFQEKAKKWHSSGEGVTQVKGEIENMYTAIESQVQIINEENSSSKFEVERGQQRDLVLWHPPYSMTFDFSARFLNTLDSTYITATVWDRQIVRSRPVMYFDDPKRLDSEKFVPQLTRNGEIRWASESHPKRSYNTKTLIEYCFKKLMDKIREKK